MEVAIAEKVVLSDEVIDLFIQLMEQVRDNQFEIGDSLISLVAMHGGKKGEVINHLAGRLNISASVLYDYYRVAERWSPEHRVTYQSLDWTIYRNSDPIEDKELLDRCIDEGWNATRFKEEKYPEIVSPSNLIGRIETYLGKLSSSRTFVPSVQHKLATIVKLIRDLKQELGL